MPEPLPMPPTKPKGDTKGKPKTAKKGLSLSLRIVEVLRSEPDRTFVVRDLVDWTGGNPDTVKRELARLSSTDKGSGPVHRVRHGMYQFAPEKEQDSLQALARSGNWKVENIMFVSLGAQGGVVSLSQTVPEQAKGTLPDASQPVPHSNVPFPWKLDTGQLVTWDDYQNGTQVIRISANGAPPISPDHAITIIGNIKNFGLDDTWKCVSLELNVDSYRHRIDSSYSLQSIEGLLLKAYQHGYNTRVEIADRREVSIREVVELFHAIAGGIEGKEAIKGVKALEARVIRNEKNTQLALNIARQVRDSKHQCKCTGKLPKKQKSPVPHFRTGTTLMQEQTPAAGAQEPV